MNEMMHLVGGVLGHLNSAEVEIEGMRFVVWTMRTPDCSLCAALAERSPYGFANDRPSLTFQQS